MADQSEDQPNMVSISWRLQRVVTEYAYVTVLVTEDLIDAQPDGTGRINVEKMVARARELGTWPQAHWLPEAVEIQMHPIQKAPEPDEQGNVLRDVEYIMRNRSLSED